MVGEGRLVKRRGWVLSIALELVMEVHKLIVLGKSGFTGNESPMDEDAHGPVLANLR